MIYKSIKLYLFIFLEPWRLERAVLRPMQCCFTIVSGRVWWRHFNRNKLRHSHDNGHRRRPSSSGFPEDRVVCWTYVRIWLFPLSSNRWGNAKRYVWWAQYWAKFCHFILQRISEFEMLCFVESLLPLTSLAFCHVLHILNRYTNGCWTSLASTKTSPLCSMLETLSKEDLY